MNELQHFSATLSNKCDYIDICAGISCNHPHQRTFSNAAAGKNSNSLPLSDGKHTVNRLYPEIQSFPNWGTVQRVNITFIGTDHATAGIQNIIFGNGNA